MTTSPIIPIFICKVCHHIHHMGPLLLIWRLNERGYNTREFFFQQSIVAWHAQLVL